MSVHYETMELVGRRHGTSCTRRLAIAMLAIVLLAAAQACSTLSAGPSWSLQDEALIPRPRLELTVLLIGIDDAKSEPNWFKERIPNPYRTGAWSVIKEEAFDRLPLCGPEADRIKEFAKKQRFMFVEHQVLVNLGIVKEKPDEGEMQQSGGVPEEVPGS